MAIYPPYVIERTSRGERSYDIFSRLLMDRIVFLGSYPRHSVSPWSLPFRQAAETISILLCLFASPIYPIQELKIHCLQETQPLFGVLTMTRDALR